MPKHNPLNFSGEQFFDHARGSRVRQMPVPRLDTLFDRPRPVFVILQKFFIMISFNHERLDFSQPFSDQFGHVTKVSNKTEAARAGLKHESDRVYRVVRHGESLQRDIANRELSASRKQSPVPASLRKTIGSKRLAGEPIAVNRQVELVAKNFKAANVIGVFVRENNTIQLLRRDAALLEAQNDLPRAETAINENLAMIRGNQRTVSRAPAAEHSQAEHGSKGIRAISFCANENGQVSTKIVIPLLFHK